MTTPAQIRAALAPAPRHEEYDLGDGTIIHLVAPKERDIVRVHERHEAGEINGVRLATLIMCHVVHTADGERLFDPKDVY